MRFTGDRLGNPYFCKCGESYGFGNCFCFTCKVSDPFYPDEKMGREEVNQCIASIILRNLRLYPTLSKVNREIDRIGRFYGRTWTDCAVAIAEVGTREARELVFGLAYNKYGHMRPECC